MRNSHKCLSCCQSAVFLFLVILLKSDFLNASEKWKPSILPRPLSTSVDYAGHPEIAISGAEVVVFWEEREKGRYAIWERKSLNEGQTWEKAEKVSPQEVPSARFPRLAVNSEGLFLLVWKRTGERGGRDALYYQLRWKGEKSWSSPERLTNDPRWPVRAFSLASSGSTFALTWSGFNPEKGFGIYFQKWRETKSSTHLQSDKLERRSSSSSEAAGRVEKLLVLDSPGRSSNKNRASDVDGHGRSSQQSVDQEEQWSLPKKLSESETLERPADFPVVVVKGEEVAVAWQDLKRDLTPLRDPIPDDWRVALKYSRDSGETWSEEIEVSRDFHFAFRPSLTWDNNGDVIILWRNKDQRISWHYRRTDLNLQTGEAIQKGRVPFPYLYVDGLRLFQQGKRTQGAKFPPRTEQRVRASEKSVDQGLFACWFSPSHADRAVVLACGDLQGKIHLLLKRDPLQGYPSLAVAGRMFLTTWAGESIYIGGWEIE